MIELTVVIPTRDRREILTETLGRLSAHAAGEPIEVIVVDDGSRDDSADAAERIAAASSPLPVRILRQEGTGPAAARNRGIAEATGVACLFIGDDSLPTPGLIERHLAFHRVHPEAGAALLGLVTPAPPLDASPFIRWLHEEGTQFGYAALEPGRPADPACFWTSNVSAKRDLLRAAGGFDEGFPGAACEDADLGFRLAAAGMALTYDPGALALHFHPTDLRATLARMRTVGVAFRRLCERVPAVAEPSRPATRHRLKAAALTAAMAAGARPLARRAAWRFLCDQVQREAYWGAGPAGELPATGARLARLALADPVALPPQPARPAP